MERPCTESLFTEILRTARPRTGRSVLERKESPGTESLLDGEPFCGDSSYGDSLYGGPLYRESLGIYALD